MPCSFRVTALTVACALVAAAPLRADDSSSSPVVPAASALVQSALTEAWTPTAPGDRAPRALLVQGRRRAASAGPNIGAVGLGAVAGLSEFEIGPSFRYWITERFGVQAHLGFSGDDRFRGEDVQYLRFEPTFIVAIGDFGNDDVNVRPYAGGGLRVVRTDIGEYDNTEVKPAGVAGVEFGFRGVPRLKVSGELSFSASNDIEDIDFPDPPELGGVRVSALVHYFFD